MIPELGLFTLILALLVAIAGIICVGFGSWFKQPVLLNISHSAAKAEFLFISLSFIILAFAFLSNDFSVAYVAQNSNNLTPWWYRFSAIWGAHEGSILLWTLILSIWTLAFSLRSRKLPVLVASQTLAVLFSISVGFIWFMLATSNPFLRYLPIAPQDGADLNPLLQDPGLVIHPPILYLGYVGAAIPFALAIVALLQGNFDKKFASWMRPWALLAWACLSVGIVLGSWWAYYELGWGGWWFWDPVENASFMPWLAGVALIHALILTCKRSAAKSWSLLLAITVFALSLIGTFLVRSGVLTSVHAFAADPDRGAFILKFLVLVIGSSLTLFAWRAPKVNQLETFKLNSKETLLLSNNVIFAVATATVFLGTLYPLVLDALNLGKISVGPPYFNAVMIPLMLPGLFLLALGPIWQWQEMPWHETWHKIKLALFASIFVAIILPYIFTNTNSIKIFLGLSLCMWIVLATAADIFRRIKQNIPIFKFNFIGMTLAHVGVAVLCLGVCLTSNYSVEKDIKLAPGEAAKIAAYNFKFNASKNITGPNYAGVAATINVSKNNQQITTLMPEKRLYKVQNSAMTEAAISPSLWRDLYVAMGEPLENSAWSFRIYYKPFVRWIWLGGLMLALGGILAAWDASKRVET